ncbi:MAG: hypothetical protein ACOYK8_00480 [Alphaproteobacteria bacterium]
MSQLDLAPRFYYRAVENSFVSAREGRPVFDEIEHVHILIPGDKTTEIDRPVEEVDKLRWPEAYKRFQEGSEPPISGTPLQQWTALSASQVAELTALNIRTVDDLAAMNDGLLSRIGPGGRSLKEKAVSFLNAAIDQAETARLHAILEARDADISVLKEQLKQLMGSKKKKETDAAITA